MPKKNTTTAVVRVVAPVTADSAFPGAGAKPVTTPAEPVSAKVVGRTAGSIPATGATFEQNEQEVAIQEAKPKLLPLGIHFGLDENTYHADPALGSTDHRHLAKNPYNYWFDSWMNPLRQRDDDTESRQVGSAMHKLIFEGREAFDRLYMCGPDQTGMTSGEKSASTKAANVQAKALGKTALKFDKYARVLMASAMITKNPYLKNVFTDGFGEVSVLWEVEHKGMTLRLKSRFDYLKCSTRRFQRPNQGVDQFMLAANGDLKSVANPNENDFEYECYQAIARYNYHAQAALYVDGLRQVSQCVLEERVFGVRPDDAKMWAWLERFLAKDVRYGWQWIFHQTTGAPLTHSMYISPESRFIRDGNEIIQRGRDRYVECMQRFGTDMWLLAEEPKEAVYENLPGWYGRN